MTAYTVKRIVCLANSRMASGRCIAGKEVTADGRPGGWVRPVSGWSTGGLSERERQYEDGTEPRVLDVVDEAVLEAKPTKVHLHGNTVTTCVMPAKSGIHAFGEKPVPRYGGGQLTPAACVHL